MPQLLKNMGIYTTGEIPREQPAVDLPLLTFYDFDDICGSDMILPRTQLGEKYWRMPTAKEFMELRDKCKITWTTYQKIGGIQNYRTQRQQYISACCRYQKRTKYRKSRFHSILLDWFRSFNRRGICQIQKRTRFPIERFS